MHIIPILGSVYMTTVGLQQSQYGSLNRHSIYTKNRTNDQIRQRFDVLLLMSLIMYSSQVHCSVGLHDVVDNNNAQLSAYHALCNFSFMCVEFDLKFIVPLVVSIVKDRYITSSISH